MPERSFFTRLFLIGGGAIALLGLIVWFVVPVKLGFPPYLFTAALAIAYGLFCWKQDWKKPKA